MPISCRAASGRPPIRQARPPATPGSRPTTARTPGPTPTDPTGITHDLGGASAFIEPAKNADGPVSTVPAGLFNNGTFGTIDTGVFPTGPTASSDRYNVTMHWAGGHLDSATYATRGDNPET